MPEPISELLQPDRLEPWLGAHLPGYRGPFTAEKTATGQSNPTFILTAASGRYVLRRKPPGRLLPSAHAVEREYRVMRALHGRGVPVPRPFVLCQDEDILGKPFFVMEHVGGITINDPVCPGLSKALRGELYAKMNGVLAAIHRTDLGAAGLTDFGRSGNYFARQLSRWTRQYRDSQTDDIPALENLMIWLGAKMPEDETSALVHGDYRLDNLRIDPSTGQVLAVLDWELSTLGHPLADLGAQLMQWSLPPGELGRGLEGVDRARLGIPTDLEYVEMYAQNAGLRDVPDMTFCIAISYFRMAAILQGVKKRALDGNASSPEKALKLGAYIPILAQKAEALLNANA